MADAVSIKQDAAPWLALKNVIVVGARLLDVADWIAGYNLADRSWVQADNAPRLHLPSIQRSSVWRPSQVLAFWDSVLRGLPVGAFYLIESKDERAQGARSICSGNRPDAGSCDVHAGDYLLLGGQQRMRALLAGLAKHNDEGRSIWIDLEKLCHGPSTQVNAPYLFLTSKAQPFGYGSQAGTKLTSDDRRKARLALTNQPGGKPERLYVRWNEKYEQAYDKDLFDAIVWRKVGEEYVCVLTPPRPYGARQGLPVHL